MAVLYYFDVAVALLISIVLVWIQYDVACDSKFPGSSVAYQQSAV